MKKSWRILLLLSMATMTGAQAISWPAPALSSKSTSRYGVIRQERMSAEELQELAGTIKFVNATLPASLKKRDRAANSAKTFIIFRAERPNPANPTTGGIVDQIYVQDLRAGKVYEIQGFAFPARPFEQLKWVSPRLFTVEQSINPHRSIRYQFDVIKQRLTAAWLLVL